MKKVNFSSLVQQLGRQQMRNVTGGYRAGRSATCNGKLCEGKGPGDVCGSGDPKLPSGTCKLELCVGENYRLYMCS